jgi:hypothetical protein
MSHRVLNRLPVIGVLGGGALLGLAATKYPGGYHWSRNTISALFARANPSGTENPARSLAVIGVLTMIGGMAVLFHLMSSEAKSAFHKKTIQIAGIGSMVYAAFTVTPMHDLMVSISLVFFLAMMFAVLHMIYFERHFRLFALGIVCLAILLASAAMYYGNVFLEFLPLGQKLSLALTVVWLFAVQFGKFRNHRPRSAQNDKA